MTLTAADFALFLHITFVIAGLCFAAVLHVGLLLMRAAWDVAAIRAWPRVVTALEVALPLTALLILLTGAWLLQLSSGEFSWGQGWVIASLVGLMVAEAGGPVAGPRSAALRRAINQAPGGPVGAERAAARRAWRAVSPQGRSRLPEAGLLSRRLDRHTRPASGLNRPRNQAGAAVSGPVFLCTGRGK